DQREIRHERQREQDQGAPRGCFRVGLVEAHFAATLAARRSSVDRMLVAVKQHQETIEVRTTGRGLVDLTREISGVVERAGVRTGLCVAFCAHTSCSLLIQENADPSVQRDLMAWLERLAPDGDPLYEHDAEGPDDIPAHLRTSV